MAANSSSADAVMPARRLKILQAQVRLLYTNANVGILVNLVAAPILGRLQWSVISHRLIVGWCLYMTVVAAGRFILGRQYSRTAESNPHAIWWGNAFAAGAGLAGAGWGLAGILLYPEADLARQVFLVFILGGMMLGAAALLASYRTAFLAFIIPTGLGPAMRLAAQGDEAHLAIGLLAILFTFAVVLTTWRVHLTVLSSLKLQFENHDLVEDLSAAKAQAEALNDLLEVRIQERTAALHRSIDQLEAEIAQREQMEEELLRARKLESLGVLAGGIAHDFNNFLTVVQGNIEMAKMHLPANDPVHAILDQSASACQRAALLSAQLLTFAKGGAPVRRLVSIAKLVTETVTLARAGSQTSIAVRISEDLWCAEVDPGQIGQVLHNILLNARQAMPEGGIIEVTAENVVCKDKAGMVRISVRDYGCGIPADALPRIFDPYFTTKPGGSGLGLATAYAIVLKHGGTLSVASTVGYGTEFTIDLPASGERPPAEPAPVAQLQSGGAQRILVMDDEPALCGLMQAILTRLGYEVQVAHDGAEAIAVCENAKAAGASFAAAVLDVTVRGGMGGVEAASRLKALDPNLKLIVSSGYSDAQVMSDYRKFGFDEAIPKPWTATELSAVVQRVLVTA